MEWGLSQLLEESREPSDEECNLADLSDADQEITALFQGATREHVKQQLHKSRAY